jgi:hypothetical protein
VRKGLEARGLEGRLPLPKAAPLRNALSCRRQGRWRGGVKRGGGWGPAEPCSPGGHRGPEGRSISRLLGLEIIRIIGTCRE